MPLTRYEIRNECGLADPELYRAADKDDPEALLEGVAMAALVGILRQLGDLAEFAAEMFHDLHEEVMATAARGHGLMARVKQLEAEFPSFEKAFLSQTDHSSFFSNTGMDWHPNLHMKQNSITHGGLPRCIMGSYEECRAPPRLFLLDKFDVAGAGACLKRYTDPSFFRLEAPSSETLMAGIQKEKKSRKVKKRGSRWRNGGTPDITPTSHAKLHQLFLEDRLESTHTDPARLVKLKTRKLNGSSINAKSGRSYMEKLLQSPSPVHKSGSEITSSEQLWTWNTDDSRDFGLEMPEVSVVGALEKSCQGIETEASSSNEQELLSNSSTNSFYGEIIDRNIDTVPEPSVDEADEIPSHPLKIIVERDIGMDRKGTSEALLEANRSEDWTHEDENYMDALATMESETETDNEGRHRNVSEFWNVGKHDKDSEVDEEQMDPQQFSDSQSIGNTSASDKGHSSFDKERSSFSYSDTVSKATKNEASDGEDAVELLTSTGTCEAEVVDLSPNQLPANKYNPGSDSKKVASVGGGDVDLVASCNSHCANSSSTLLPQDVESCLPKTQPLAPISVETSLDSVRLGPENFGTDERGINLADSSISVDRSSDILDAGDSSLSFEALQHLTKLPDPAPEEKGCETNNGDILQKDYADSSHSENVGNMEVGSLHPTVTPIEKQVPHWAKPEIEMPPDDAVLEVSDLAVADIHSEDVSRLVTETDNSVSTKGIPGVDAKLTRENSSSMGTEADETTADIDDVNLEKRATMDTEIDDGILALGIHSEENKPITDISPTSSSECEQLLDTSLKPQSNYPEDEHLGNGAGLDLVAPETFSEDEVAVSRTAVTGAGEDMQEFVSGAGELHQKGLTSNGTLSSAYHSESNIGLQTNPLEIASPDLDSMPFRLMSDLPSSQELSVGTQYSSPGEPNSNQLTVGYASILQMSSDKRDLEPESLSLHQNNILPNGTDAVVLGACDLPLHESPAGQANEVKALHVENLQSNEVVSKSMNVESERLSCLDQKDQEINMNASIEFTPEAFPGQGILSETLSQSAGQEFHNSKAGFSLDSDFPSFGLLPEATKTTSMEEMPPLPPLPPMPWRIVKVQHAVPASEGEPIGSSDTLSPTILPFAADRTNGLHFRVSDEDTMQSAEEGKTEQFVGDMGQPSSHLPTMIADVDIQYNSPVVEGGQSFNPYLTSPLVSNLGLKQDFLSPESNIMPSRSIPSLLTPSAQNTTPSQDHISSQEMPAQPQTQLGQDKSFQDSDFEHISQNSGEFHDPPDASTSLKLPESMKLEEKPQIVSLDSEGETAQPSNSSTQRAVSSSVGDAMWPVNAFALASTFDAERPNENITVKLPRPRSPLVDAVAAHDRSTLRKASERVRPPIEMKVEEKDSWLAQIRNKSFNLKPALVSRPGNQVGPNTNLKVAAILEKANTIRQAMAGSDEDDDSDTWSDS